MRRLVAVSEGPWPAWDTTHGPCVTDMDAALAHLASEPYDAIVLRAQSTSHGIPALQRLAQHGPVVVVGPAGDVPTAKEFMLAGARDYIEETDMHHSTLRLAVDCARNNHITREHRDRIRRQRWMQEAYGREQELRQALIDHLADRLNNPMTVILLQCRALAQRLGDDPSIPRIQQAAHKMRQTVQEISAAFRAQRGRWDHQLRDVDLREVHDACMQDRPEVQWRASVERVVVRSDPGEVASIMDTMLRQVTQWTPDSNEIYIALGHDNEQARYRITMPAMAGTPAALLDPFARMEDLRSEGDLGLRLYAARLAAKELQGDIEASGTPDSWSLTLRLPLRAARRVRVAVVEQAESIRAEVRRLVRLHGIRSQFTAGETWDEVQDHLDDARPDHIYVGTPRDMPAPVLIDLLQRRGHAPEPLASWLNAHRAILER